jgi:hypothetical protein
MSRPRWLGRAITVLAVAALLAGATAPTLSAAPNPYGDRSTATTVVLHPDGSYDVTLRQTQELVREYQITFGGGAHDGFRLPDDGALLPPYLRAGYALTSVSAAGVSRSRAASPGPTTWSPPPVRAPTRPVGTSSRSATG